MREKAREVVERELLGLVWHDKPNPVEVVLTGKTASIAASRVVVALSEAGLLRSEQAHDE